MDESLEVLDVKLEGPKNIQQNKTATYKAIVTQGDEPVADADEVMFEIWKDGAKAASEMIEAEYEEEGTYLIETTFSQEGTYYVQSHVTARSMHTMPKQQVTVTKSE
jgi:hypothetical protein